MSLDAGRLLGADCAAIVRFQDADRVTILGRWTHDEHGPDDPDATVAVAPGSLLDRLRCGEAMAHDRMDGDYHCERLAAQVRSSAAVWGALVVVASDPTSSPRGPRSASRSTPTSSPPRWPTPRTAPASTARRPSTR